MTERESPRTALYDTHVAMEAKMGVEAGWEMPLSYAGPLEEAGQVRRRAGIFDVSHYGRIRIRGDGALGLLERACSANVAGQEDNTSMPTLLCNRQGGIIDCCRLIRLASFWVLVTSPICRVKVLEHLAALNEAEGFGAKVDDQTPRTTMLAVAGPAARDILAAVLPFSISGLAAGEVRFGSLLVARYIAERIDLAGLWAARVSIPNMAATQAWRFATRKAGADRLSPAGTGALDILRIEAGLPRYGYEINETVDPPAAGLMDQVDLGHDFLGAEAVSKATKSQPARVLAGLVLEGPCGKPDTASIPRQGSAVTKCDGTEAGVVTSGTFSAALERPIAICFVSRQVAEAGSELLVATPAGPRTAEPAELPFVAAE